MPSHPLSENTKHSFPENGYECFFVYIRKEEKMESEKIKAGVRASNNDESGYLR